MTIPQHDFEDQEQTGTSLVFPLAEPIIFGPGPGRLAQQVKAAQQADFAARGEALGRISAELVERLRRLHRAPKRAVVLVPGSATTALDAAFASAISPDTKVLVAVNGAYGARLAELASRYGAQVDRLEAREGEPLDARAVRRALARSRATLMAWCHGETSGGVLNPLDELAACAREAGAQTLVDVVSTFATLSLPLSAQSPDYVVASSAKALEGPAGLAWVLATPEQLERGRGRGPFSLDLCAQWERFERDGQFRFTPPVQIVAGTLAALRLFESEGGAEGRRTRYQARATEVLTAFSRLGYESVVSGVKRLPILVSLRTATPNAPRPEELLAHLSKHRIFVHRSHERAGILRIGLVGVSPQDTEHLAVALEKFSA